MPWEETEPMKERMRFVVDAERGLYSMTELCERYGISRRTGYKWRARYDVRGPAGLLEGSRAPHGCPHRLDAGVAAALVEARRQHPSWGPRKLVAWLGERRPDVEWPGGRLAQAPGLGSTTTAPAPLAPSRGTGHGPGGSQ